jgi:ion channel-forming bestrophin family protein
MTSYQVRKGFWREAIALQGSVTVQVLPSVFASGLIAAGFCGLAWLMQRFFQARLTLEVTAFPVELAGVALGLLLVIRTNAGYDRWWEARKFWGGIVNQSRNLVISALAYGPNNAQWRDEVVRWSAVLPHVTPLSLRGERSAPEVDNLVGAEQANHLASVDHMPNFVALKLGNLLQEACERFNMDRFAFLQIDRERAMLIDHIGACERILTTPLPRIYSIKIRRFVLLFLLLLPLALLHQFDPGWSIPVITMLVAYPLLSLDQIGVELENPFSTSNLSHLPLDDIAANIERNLLNLLKEQTNGC